MKTISTTQLRSQTRSLVSTLADGKSVALTYRGKQLAKIWPVKPDHGVATDDPLYRFHQSADNLVKPLTDREIDRLVYGI